MPDLITGVDINEKPVADLESTDSYKLLGSVDGAVKRINPTDLPFIGLPTEGQEGQVLTTDGSGNYSWEYAEVSDKQVEDAVEAYEAANIYSPVAPVETSLTATRAYSVGDFFEYHKELYKVTAAIASGESIVVNTNCQKTFACSQIQSKQDTLTFDNTPTASSNNPVKSGGVKDALDEKADLTVIAGVEAEAVASQAYAIGDYLVLGGILYRVTAAIASGAGLVVDTNIEATVVGDELKRNRQQNENRTLYLTNQPISATTGDILSLSNAKITADHIVTNIVFANSAYITAGVDWTTGNGTLVLNGTCTTATTADITLTLKDN